MASLSRRRKLVFSLVACVLGLFLVEAGSRVVYTLREDLSSFGTWYAFSPDVGWRPRPSYEGTVFGGSSRKFDENGFLRVDSDQLEDDARPKVLFLGDSITFGFGVSTESTFVEQLDRLLPDVSAINAGVIGYSSYQGFRTIEQLGKSLKPDVVVASFNFNDRRWVSAADYVDGTKKFAQMSSRGWGALLHKSYFPKLVNLVKHRFGSRTSAAIQMDSLYPRVSPDDYRQNLNRIAEVCLDIGAKCVFLVLNDNPVDNAYAKQGQKLMAAGDVDRAIGLLHVAIEKKKNWSTIVARQDLIKAYASIDKKDEAEKLKKIENWYSDWMGGVPMFDDYQYNDIMRDVAMKQGLRVVEAGNMLDEQPSDYLDWCHPDANGHRRIAILLKDTIVATLAERTVTVD